MSHENLKAVLYLLECTSNWWVWATWHKCHVADPCWLCPRQQTNIPPLEMTRREIGCVHISGFESDGGDEISLQREDDRVKQVDLNLRNLGVGFPFDP